MPTKVQTIRTILSTLILTSVLAPSLFQPFIDKTWSYLLASRLYRLSTFETIWTVLSYAIIEPYVTYIFMTQPERRLVVQDLRARDLNAPIPRHPRGMKRPSRRGWEAVVYVLPLLCMDLTMIKKYAGAPLEDIAASGGYSLSTTTPSYAHELHNGISANTTTTTTTTHPLGLETFLIPTLHNLTLTHPTLQTTRALPPQPPTPLKLLLDLTLSFLLYDFLFFALHLTLHLSPFPLLNQSHNTHHSHPSELQPQITNALSVPERLSLVLLANFSLNAVQAHVLSRTLFVPLFVWMLVELHCGMELGVGFEKILPKGWAVGARKHAEHHRTGRGGYEPFFGWWDKLWEWGVEWRRRKQRVVEKGKGKRKGNGSAVGGRVGKTSQQA